ncbi:hypothetical protein C8T65DRAFT_599267 [Cerioporus squamosus]|nr:hypothetical protein C8T65DRAFT_599267 [Cerioporus squamosus]
MPHHQQDSEPVSFFQVSPPAEVYGYVQNPADFTDDSGDEDGDHDIYRGTPPTPPRSPSPMSSSSSTSSSSSSSVSIFGGRLGAISAGVENAISRWARAWMSSSSLSSSSSSSASVATQAKSHTTRRRKRRPRSIATLHNARSEREVAARIRAREDLRTIPRGFVLYAPKRPIAGAKSQAAADRKAARAALQDPILRSTSLDVVMNRLNAVLRESAKARRVRTEPAQTQPQARSTPPTIALSPHSRPLSPLHQDYMLSDESDVARSTPSIPGHGAQRKDGKGKQRASVVQLPQSPPVVPVASPPPQIALEPQRAPKAWWLDVSSPTWEDMCAIGKLLHLHPLTLEDILTQDPREKLELFPRLGYYFISFRAIESQKTRERIRNLLSQEDLDSQDEGIVAEVNMYLVVFRDGICSFHFADLDEHVDRVRHRIMLLGDSAITSSEWIAHGLMDSIVDSFFPYLDIIEKEALAIDRLVFSAGDETPVPKEDPLATLSEQTLRPGSPEIKEKISVDVDEKGSFLGKATTKSVVAKPRFSSPTSFPLLVRRARRAIRETLTSIPRFRAVDTQSSDYYHPLTTVHRMARIRRLVTSLTRFLAVKSEVVAQVRKRLLAKGEWSLGTGTEDDLDVFVYMGDVQDHILTLQQSLAHYERMLSQSHPTYLSQLRTSVSKAKSGSDKAIVALTVVSLGVLCVQTLIGLFSMNCDVPHNDLEGNRYDVFATVIAIAVVVIIMYSFVVRHWWKQAKRRRLPI